MKKYIFMFLSAGLFLTSCVNNPDGEKAATSESVTVSEKEGKSLNLDLTQSKLIWTGAKVTATHHGTVQFKSGNLMVNNGQLVGGEFVFDMHSIVNEDQEGEWNDKLVGHLKSDDFFGVEQHPEASFVITDVKPTDNPNVVVVSGNLVIKGISKNISFNANVEDNSDTNVKMNADFNIAREEWGLNYPGAPDNLISKEINFKVNIVAQA